jgi:hypothetical protein
MLIPFKYRHIKQEKLREVYIIKCHIFVFIHNLENLFHFQLKLLIIN